MLWTPLIFMMIFITVQASLYFFARHVLEVATQEALDTARTEAASPASNWRLDAQNAWNQWIQDLAPNLVKTTTEPDLTLSTQDGVQLVTITATATVPSWIGTLTVTDSITAPVEQFYPDTGD